MRIVVDTNVLVSSLLNPKGTPASVARLILSGRVQTLYDDRIMREYVDVLHRDKFGFDSESIKDLIDFIEHEGQYVVAEPVDGPFGDEDDRAFFEVAVSGEASALVTGNRTHYPEEKIIKSPSEFLSEYKAANLMQ